LPFRHLLPVAVLLCPLNLTAQINADSATSGDSAVVDSALVIHRVQLIRRDIFDPNERSWLARAGNKLHFQTRAPVIRREVLLRPGQVYDSALVAESERNLRSMGIFRRVQIDSVRTDSGLVLRVLTKDGWSTQLDWRFRSTGGEVAFTLGMVETNLLGTASSAAIRYRNDPDRNSIALGFRRRRFCERVQRFVRRPELCPGADQFRLDRRQRCRLGLGRLDPRLGRRRRWIAAASGEDQGRDQHQRHRRLQRRRIRQLDLDEKRRI